MSLVGTRPPTVDEWEQYEFPNGIKHSWANWFEQRITGNHKYIHRSNDLYAGIIKHNLYVRAIHIIIACSFRATI